MEVRESFSLKKFNTFDIEVACKYFDAYFEQQAQVLIIQ